MATLSVTVSASRLLATGMLAVMFSTTAYAEQSSQSHTTTSAKAGQVAPIGGASNVPSGIERRAKNVLPKYDYTTDNLSKFAQKVNNASWQQGKTTTGDLDQALGVKLQALLDWNHASPGPIDGLWGNNTAKAVEGYQKIHGLKVTGKLDQALWDKLVDGMQGEPVLVRYTVTQDDVNTPLTQIPSGAAAKSELEGMYYESLTEMFAEKFHMHANLFEQLNGKSGLYQVGDVLTVINVNKPALKKITKLIADKQNTTLFAYHGDELIATYPTTVGSASTPSPSGTHTLVNRIYEPNYTYTNNGTTHIIPPGPNTPVGIVWLGLSKDSYGIHGSPDPERISRQASGGCVRLTNWDALELYTIIDNDASVSFR